MERTKGRKEDSIIWEVEKFWRLYSTCNKISPMEHSLTREVERTCLEGLDCYKKFKRWTFVPPLTRERKGGNRPFHLLKPRTLDIIIPAGTLKKWFFVLKQHGLLQCLEKGFLLPVIWAGKGERGNWGERERVRTNVLLRIEATQSVSTWNGPFLVYRPCPLTSSCDRKARRWRCAGPPNSCAVWAAMWKIVVLETERRGEHSFQPKSREASPMVLQCLNYFEKFNAIN